MERLQAWISNIAFPTSADELCYTLNHENGMFDLEVILLEREGVYWTAPRWAKKGDIIFFMHSVSAVNKIRALEKQLAEAKDAFSGSDADMIREGLRRARVLYRAYGGKVFGAARLESDPVRRNTESFRHWRSNSYAKIIDTCAFDNPLPLSEFRDLVPVCRTGSVTPLFEGQFNGLRNLLKRDNRIPEFINNACADGLFFGSINSKNWIDYAGKAKQCFVHEEQFRCCCTDYLLKTLSNTVYRECRCRKSGVPDSFADNVIMIEGKYLPVEIKVRIDANVIREQLWKYCYNDSILPAPGKAEIPPSKLWQRHTLLIDPEAVRIYDAEKDVLNEVFALEGMHGDELPELKTRIIEVLTA